MLALERLGQMKFPILPRWVWNVIAFPLKLHDDRPGVAVSARVIEKK